MQTTLILRNEASRHKVEPAYWPLIHAVVGTVARQLGADLREVRLLGSIGRGCAIAGHSDLDLLVITCREESPQTLAALRESASAVPGATSLVSRVDLQCMSLEAIGVHLEYELIVRTDSVNLFGEDHFDCAEVAIINTELARLWTPNIDAILRDYRCALENLDLPAAEVMRYSRLTGKDIMKCFQRTVLLRQGLIERSVERMHHNLKTYLPQYGEVMDTLWKLYRFPTDRREDVLAALEMCRQVKGNILSEGEDAR